jgi:acyl dehydratase
VRPGDELTVRATVLETRVSQSRPDRGFIKFQYDMFNASGLKVMTLTTSLMIARRTQA